MTRLNDYVNGVLCFALPAILALGTVGAGGTASAEDGGEEARGSKPTIPKGIIHNEDSSHIYFAHDVEEMTLDMLNGWIDQYADTQLTHFFMCANAMRTSFRSEVWDNIWRTDDPELLIAQGRFSEPGAIWARNAYRLDQQGIDPYAVWIERCHKHGISPWVSMRMNDCHENGDVDSYLHSTFWVEHPEFWRGGEGYFARCLDYGAKDVRDHHMKLIREYLERYDLDGLELDWMREAYCFKPGEEAEGRPILTAFMRDVRALANQRGEERGRPIKIAVRVPAVPEASFAMGLDGVAWAKEGLVDILTPTARWVTADFDIPVDRWRELMGDACERVTLAAGLENRIEPFPGSNVMGGTPETRRGFAASAFDRGADQIYLFNHMRNPATPIEENRRTYNEVGALNTVLGKPRRHLVTYHDISPPDKSLPRALPADVTGDKTASFRIHVGPKPTTGQVLVRVGLDQTPDLADAQLSVAVNGIDCAPTEDNPQPALFCSSVRLLQCSAPLDAVKRGYNQIDVALQNGGPQRIVWMELYIVP